MNASPAHITADALISHTDHVNGAQPIARPAATSRQGVTRLRAGLGIAALVGVITASGATTGLGHAINAIGPNDTTCCAVTQSRMA